VFTDDEEGYGRVIGTGEVPEENVAAARIGVLSCPERAITLAD
jgi:ferredoxin